MRDPLIYVARTVVMSSSAHPAREHNRELGCFVEGTLVHTREGLRRIESIQVGDFVLSKPESGAGEPSYTRVTRTFAYDDREVYLLYYTLVEPRPNSGKRMGETLVATGAHPLRARNLVDGADDSVRPVDAWRTAEELFEAGYHRQRNDHMPLMAEIELRDGRRALLQLNDPLLRTAQKDRGITYTGTCGWDEVVTGVEVWFTAAGPRVEWDTSFGFGRLQHAAMNSWEVEEESIEGHPPDSVFYRSGGYHPLRRQVFDLEVEDNHSYYVGESGVLVHDATSVELGKMPMNLT